MIHLAREKAGSDPGLSVGDLMTSVRRCGPRDRLSSSRSARVSRCDRHPLRRVPSSVRRSPASQLVASALDAVHDAHLVVGGLVALRVAGVADDHRVGLRDVGHLPGADAAHGCLVVDALYAHLAGGAYVLLPGVGYDRPRGVAVVALLQDVAHGGHGHRGVARCSVECCCVGHHHDLVVDAGRRVGLVHGRGRGVGVVRALPVQPSSGRL